ncbi:MAG: Lon protease family protein [Promethearchaeota archaeon]
MWYTGVIIVKELTPKQLRVVCIAKDLECKTSADFTPLKDIVGQKRALKALAFGLEIDDHGFNIYVSGAHGTGRTTAVTQYLNEIAAKDPVPSDVVYVSNFGDQYQPMALLLSAGKGNDLVVDLDHFIEAARNAIAKMLDGEEYAGAREERRSQYERQRNAILTEMQAKAQKAGFALRGTQTGLVIVPMMDGEEVKRSQVAKMPADERERIENRREALETELRKLFRKLQSLERELVQELRKMEEEAVRFTLNPLIDDFLDEYTNYPEVSEFIHAIAKDITENLAIFMGQPGGNVPVPPPQQPSRSISPEEFSKRYRANLIVDNSEQKGAPVLIVTNPTYSNLFGRIEKEPRFGTLFTDFSMIRPGALHQANGGYIVIPVRDLLLSPLSYPALKRALQNNHIVIEEPAEQAGFLSMKTLRPAPIPLKIKVVLIGDPFLYQQLYILDPDFRELFKVKADFDTTMDRSEKNIRRYGSFVCSLVQKEKLRALTAEAIAEVVDYSSRLAENQTKLSVQFSVIADVIREANYYAKEDRKRLIDRKHIIQALEARLYRSNLLEEKIREFIEREVILITVKGEEVGQINGLSVLSLGDFAFGRPSRVTASVAPGRGRVIDIERESGLGGNIHHKGVHILSGYLSEKFGREKPLSLSARLVFEQSYSGVEGDSASSTELYALLSALSGVPIQQRFAVTGSVNQHGEVQAIGGVNEKIEGYFAVCKVLGLTGDQGVLIPKANIQNLMLKEEVVKAVEAGKFHLYAVETIDEGIELLTGKPASEINKLADKRLKEMADVMRDYGTPLK